MVEYRRVPYADGYRVGDDGSFWRFKRGEWVLMKTSLDAYGYPRSSLIVDGERIHRTIHRLVLEAFVGLCPPGMECRHMDGYKTNNRLSNLAWGTSTENKADSLAHGVFAVGERKATAKLTADQVRAIRQEYAAGGTQVLIAKKYGICQTQVSSIVRREKWKHLV